MMLEIKTEVYTIEDHPNPERVYSGKLLTSGIQSDSIAFETSDGIKRLNIYNVIGIKGV